METPDSETPDPDTPRFEAALNDKTSSENSTHGGVANLNDSIPVATSASESVQAVESKNDDVGFVSLDPNSIPADRIASFIFTVIVLVAGIIGLGVLFAAIGLGLVWYSIAAGGATIALFLLWASYFWPSIEYHHKSWRLNDVGLEIRNGVWWKHQLAIPWARVQHADVSQGPLQRLYGLGSLTVHTAGTTDSSVTIEGLAHQTALELRDEVIRQRKSSDVV